MKKMGMIFIVLLFSLSVFPCFAYSSKKNIKYSELVTIEGFVKCYGNEPFTYLGISTSEGIVYKIIASEEVISELFAKQGEEIIFYGIIIQTEAAIPYSFEVIKFENK